MWPGLCNQHLRAAEKPHGADGAGVGEVREEGGCAYQNRMDLTCS